jgi:hypothetical protein
VCGGAFTGLEKIISARSRPGSIGFEAKVMAPEDRKQGEIFREVEPEETPKIMANACRGISRYLSNGRAKTIAIRTEIITPTGTARIGPVCEGINRTNKTKAARPNGVTRVVINSR